MGSDKDPLKRFVDVDTTTVTAKPVKSFFVTMLTRDISLGDAILDLLDNCMDGIIRSLSARASSAHPYRGYWARMEFDSTSFSIVDNCGGIPWALHDYAFRMGRAGDSEEAKSGSIGTYGIGMKRAIFKIGRHALIQTQHKRHIYEVEVTSKWLDKEDDWDLPVENLLPVGDEDGTFIIVDDLNKDVQALFSRGRELFEKELRDKIQSHYALIIEKGFVVSVNGDEIKPRPIRLRFGATKGSIQPFIYEATVGEVDVFLAVGFTRPIPSMADIERETEEEKYSSMDAGWTVICNDRVVVYCDRTELTGWGEASVPRYHTQFIAIAGIVEFTSNNPSQLPMTTTKRGVDASSLLYLKVKNKMREGLRVFTSFTNRWKGRERAGQAQAMIRDTPAMPVGAIREKAVNIRKTKVNGLGGRQFKPTLPSPPQEPSQARISFERPGHEVQTIAEYLDERPAVPSRIGERCFDIVLREAQS